MVREISEDTDAKIKRAYLSGLARDETARLNSVSEGHVSSVWDDLKAEIGLEGEAIRDLAVKLRHDHVSIEQAAKGANIAPFLEKMNVDYGKFADFVSKVYQASKKYTYKPEQIVDYSMKLFDLSTRTGYDYEQLIQDYKSKKEEVAKLEEQIKKSREEHSKAIEETSRALDGKNVIKEALNEYVQARGELQSFGQDIKDASKLCNMLKNAGEREYNVQGIIESIGQVETLSADLKHLGAEVVNLGKKKADLEKEVDELNKTKLETAASIKEIGNTAVSEMKSTSEEANQLILKVRDEVETSMGNVRMDIANNMKIIEQNGSAGVSKMESSVSESILRLKEVLDKINPAIEELLKAEEVGEQIGKLEAFSPLFEIFREDQGTRYEVLPIIRIVLNHFSLWLSSHPDLKELTEKTDSLITSMDKELVE